MVKSMKKKVVKKNEAVFPVGEVMSMLESMNEGIAVIAESQVGFAKRFDDIDGRLGRLETKVDVLQDDVTDIKYTLTIKADRSEVQKLEKRMVKVERAVFAKKA